MPGHKTTHTQLERFKFIDSILSTGDIVSFDQILASLRLEFRDDLLSDSTLRRDIRYMRDELGAPLVYDAGKHGWKYTKVYKLPADNFSDDEILFLFIMKKLLNQHSNDSYFYKAFDSLLSKICPEKFPENAEAFETEENDKDNPLLFERFFIPNRPKPVLEEDVGEKIFYAIKNNYLLDFTYNSKWEPEEKHRKIIPYQIVLDDGSLFLYGANYRHKDLPRLFKLSKMHDVKVINKEHFVLPKNFRFHEEAEQGRFGAFQYDDYFTFKIEFYGEGRVFAHEYIWSDNQIIEEDNEREVTTITFESSQWEPIHQLILAQRGNARPLEPDWFVEEWKGYVKKLSQLL